MMLIMNLRAFVADTVHDASALGVLMSRASYVIIRPTTNSSYCKQDVESIFMRLTGIDTDKALLLIVR